MRVVVLIALAGLLAFAQTVTAAAATADSQEPQPTLKLAGGLEASLFAAEPLLSSPSDIDVDAKGRIWVCEVLNYRAKKNTRVEGDRILVLEDSDGDGKADRQTVFHQGRDIDTALGICVIGEGPGRKVIVSCSPDVFVFHDDDGDLKADRRESLFSKTGDPQHDHSVHAFVVGPDGRWYFNFGNTGRAVHDKDGQPVRDRFGNEVIDSGKPWRQGMVFRCKPDGGDFEVLGHNFRNNYELAVDAFGDLWQSDNDDDGHRSTRINFVMEYGNFGYKDEISGAGWQTYRTNLEPESPQRHWHLNDPGVVPNLLQTGAGSPAGICVYEGGLLPERYRGSLLHCDAGQNLVRAYHLRSAGAGYSAESENLLDGSADKWFRPSDVCVAPDGSIIVADWHDPGVGGHGMGDTEKGRIYRVAPRGSKWSVPAVDLGSLEGAVLALASPNHCTRATALERLSKEPEAAAAALDRALAKPSDDRHAARMIWALGMLPGRGPATIKTLVAANDPRLRIIGLRICRLTKGDVLEVIEKLVDDPVAAVRREAALALRGIGGERADRVWAALAARHETGDRWELEALGIGADSPTGIGGPSLWDDRLAAWLTKVGDGWKSPAGREVVWRSRAVATAGMLCELIGDPSISTAESLALVRALDFQDQARAAAEIAGLVETFSAPEEKLRVILPELVQRLAPSAARQPAVARRISEAADFAAGTQVFVNLVRRFDLRDRVPDLVALAGAGDGDPSVASAAAAAALDLGGIAAFEPALSDSGDEASRLAADRLRNALGIVGSKAVVTLLEGTLADPDASDATRGSAVRALARSRQGAARLLTLAKSGNLVGASAQAAGVAISASPWSDLRNEAAGVLPLPKVRDGGQLPSVAELMRQEGDASRGQTLFAGAATCAKCHVVNGTGKGVGPDLSGVGTKLSRQALYESILAPSAAISHNYETYTALLDDGRSLTGLLISQSPEEVIIRGPDAIDLTIPTAAIEELVKQPVSLMPADLAATLTAQELTDLVAWLETLRGTN